MFVVSFLHAESFSLWSRLDICHWFKQEIDRAVNQLYWDAPPISPPSFFFFFKTLTWLFSNIFFYHPSMQYKSEKFLFVVCHMFSWKIHSGDLTEEH